MTIAASLTADWDALVSEGHCVDCRGRLRTLTPEEQAAAAGWWREPFGVCTVCFGVHTKPRPDQPEHGRLAVIGISWNTPDLTDPFKLRTVVEFPAPESHA